MSCWHAHGPLVPRIPAAYPPPDYYPPRRPRRRARDADDLADYLRHLEDKITRVRRELAELQGSGTADR